MTERGLRTYFKKVIGHRWSLGRFFGILSEITEKPESKGGVMGQY